MEIDEQPRRRSARRRPSHIRQMEERLRQEAQQNAQQMEIAVERNNQQGNEQQNENPQRQEVQQEEVNNVQEEAPQQRPLNPLLQDQGNQQTVKVAPGLFTNKIPNIDALRDFFIHQCKRYCPTNRDMTTSFAKDILSGKKKLLKLSEVLWVNDVPRYREICSKAIWNEVKTDDNLTVYMPDFPKSRLPQKAYLLNVMNTVRPNSVIKYIKELRKKREMVAIEESPIIMTTEFSQLLGSFDSISTNKKVKGLNGLRTKPERDNCCICFSVMSQRNPMKWFQCRKHKGHRRCVDAYYNNRQDQQYLCPFRCEQAQEQR